MTVIAIVVGRAVELGRRGAGGWREYVDGSVVREGQKGSGVRGRRGRERERWQYGWMDGWMDGVEIGGGMGLATVQVDGHGLGELPIGLGDPGTPPPQSTSRPAMVPPTPTPHHSLDHRPTRHHHDPFSTLCCTASTFHLSARSRLDLDFPFPSPSPSSSPQDAPRKIRHVSSLPPYPPQRPVSRRARVLSSKAQPFQSVSQSV
ncbi:uncharacterized protein J3D65DRAFT_431922 [Phyllosticta citribraziliensis]|uniref:Uncharacterized protein n=1 Tax=Phyllosticta citribraziliensis TaxID=989973 RepID=A0ABR1LID6_9PEZI